MNYQNCSFVVNMPEKSNISFCIILFCQSIPPKHIKDMRDPQSLEIVVSAINL